MNLYHGMPGNELPTPADLTTDEVSRLLDPESKDVPELRPNSWLTGERERLQAIIDGSDDPARGLALADLSMRMANLNRLEAQDHAAAALEIGAKLGDQRILAAGHCTLGWAIYNRDSSEWRAAADHAVEAEYLFHDLQIPEWEAQAMILRMAVAAPSGTDSLITGLDPAISSLLRECPDDRDEYIWLFGLSRLSLSMTYYAHEDHALANRYLALTVLYARQIPEPLHIADVHWACAIHANDEGRFAEAKAHATRMGLIGKIQRAPQQRLRSLWLLADSLVKEGDLSAARTVLSESAGLVQADSEGRLARTHMQQGLEILVLKSENRWDEAEEALLKLAPRAEKTHRGNVAEVCRAFIDIYKAKGTIGDHIDVYDRLIKELERTMHERSALHLQAVDLMQSAETRRKLRRSDEVLRTILPSSVYAEVVEKGESEPRFYPNAVLFLSDFAGFTRIASALTPRQVIEELSDMFAQFDAIMADQRCEHIETIGDCYMAVAGLGPGHANSEPSADAARMARAALGIQDYLSQRNRSAAEIGGTQFLARIGLHSGPIIGGLVGRSKVRYGIFGDPTNTTQRFEAACEPGGVLVSQQMHALLTRGQHEGAFQLAPHAQIEAKGKGALEAWSLAPDQ